MPLTPEFEALLREKADEKIGVIIRGNLPALFAGLVVFRSDAFVHQSAMLDRRNLPVLDAFGNAAMILLNAPDVPALLAEKEVKKVYYLCRQAVLPRIHPALEIEILRRFAAGKENEPIVLLLRFREAPGQRDRGVLSAAGFETAFEAGPVLSVRGPASALPRLLEYDRIVFFEGAATASPK